MHGHVNVPANNHLFSTFIGWFVDYTRPLYLVIPTINDLDEVLKALQAIGIDNIPGYFTPEVVEEHAATLPVISSSELAARLPLNGLTVVDVRGLGEYAEKHMVGAKHIPLGYLPQHFNELPKDKTVVTQCATGYRSQIAASLLRAHGFKHVLSLNEGIDTWSQVLATEANS